MLRCPSCSVCSAAICRGAHVAPHRVEKFCSSGKETGNSKFNKAKEKGSKLLTEQGLMALVAASEPFVEEAAAEEAEAAAEDDIMEVDPPKLEPKPESATPSKAGTSKAGTSKAGTSRDAQVMAARKEAETPVDPSTSLPTSFCHWRNPYFLCTCSVFCTLFTLIVCEMIADFVSSSELWTKPAALAVHMSAELTPRTSIHS